MKVELTTPDNRYFKAHFDIELELYEIYWHETSSDMTDIEYQRWMQHQLEVMLENEYFKYYKNQLIDSRNFQFTMSPALQDWQDKNINQVMLKEMSDYPKTAFIQSKDFITQLSLEQTMDETDETSGLVRYFDNELEAKSWLLGIADTAD